MFSWEICWPVQPEIKGFPSGEEYKADNFNAIYAAEYLKLMCFSLNDVTTYFISGIIKHI